MIDIHNHLLSGMDDGPNDPDETMAMCRLAAEDGIRVIAATPHLADGQFINNPDEIISAVTSLNRLVIEAGLNLRIVPGMEVRVAPDLVEKLRSGRILPLNQGRYVLLDLHPAHLAPGLARLLKKVGSAGYGIVLGHLEKNIPIQENPEHVYELLKELPPWRLVLQISADSLLGEAGSAALKTAKILLRHNLAHVIATDAHSSRVRLPRLSLALRVAERVVGKDRARMMAREIPLAILRDRNFPGPSEPIRPKSWWRR
ncbi:MAG: CpsB/CapC family capsule biosynthesis tyrosine phosphatase [Thermodesulfobacteriota bacterium]